MDVRMYTGVLAWYLIGSSTLFLLDYARSQNTSTAVGVVSSDNRSTEHTDPRFHPKVLELVVGLEKTVEVLYIIFERSICKFNEQYNKAKSACACDNGWETDDCNTMSRKCGTVVPACLNGGTCFNGVCGCPDTWSGVDCNKAEQCNPNPCPVSFYQRCSTANGKVQCQDSLPIRVQFARTLECTETANCSFNEVCQNGWCICKPGTVKTQLKPVEKCEPGLVTCFGQEDCSLLSDNLVCRHDTLPMSNKLQYTGKGPYCLCYDDKKMDESTGLCITNKVVYLEDIHVTKLGFWETYWPIFAGLAIVVFIAFGVSYKLLTAKSEDDDDDTMPSEYRKKKRKSSNAKPFSSLSEMEPDN